MSAPYYEVEFHAICVFYFGESSPSALDISQLWTSLTGMGKRSATMSYVCRGDTEVSKLKKSRIGSPALSEVLIAKFDRIVSIGGASIRPNARNGVLDSDVNFIFNRNGVWDGRESPTALHLSLSNNVIEQVGSKAILDILEQFALVADKSSPICGLVDVASPTDAAAGMIYGTAWPRSSPLNRWIEQMGWLYSAAKKGDRVRGLYWGNYLGLPILKRLGGKKVFNNIVLNNARNFDGSPNAHCWDLTNGLFVSLCLDPTDCRPNSPVGIHPAAENNLKWLIRELGEKGVLNHW